MSNGAFGREIAAVIEADVKASGARTPAEVRAALVASALTLAPSVACEVIPSPPGAPPRRLTVRLSVGRLHGDTP